MSERLETIKIRFKQKQNNSLCIFKISYSKIANFDGLYKWQAENRTTRPVFRLQDGPPYANGDIHIGHMVNKVLKDIYLRYKLVSGYRVEYTPGWDCHGLPIELSALKSLNTRGKSSSSSTMSLNKSSPSDIRRMASEYALRFVDAQMSSFRRMNLLADWSQIYRTIDPVYMCNELDVFYRLYDRQLIYRDYMPVYWSVSSQTALAESELEYNLEHESNALYVAFPVVQIPHDIQRFLSNNCLYFI